MREKTKTQIHPQETGPHIQCFIKILNFSLVLNHPKLSYLLIKKYIEGT